MKASPEIFSLFEEQDPLANLCFLHYGVALHLLTERWFAKDAGRRLVRALQSSFDNPDPQWVEMIEWAKTSVGIEG